MQPGPRLAMQATFRHASVDPDSALCPSRVSLYIQQGMTTRF